MGTFIKVTRNGLGETMRITPKQIVIPAELANHFTDVKVEIGWDEEDRVLMIRPSQYGEFTTLARGNQLVINASVIGKLLDITEGSRLYFYNWEEDILYVRA